MAGYALKGWRLAVLSGGTFVWIALLGQWKWAMETLSVIVVATPFSVMLGLGLGVLAWRSRWFERVLTPVLNIAQSLPHFAYMIPVLAIAGSLAAKPKLEASEGTFPTDGPLFIGLLIGVILIMGGLQFFPALALGPIVEHFQVLQAVAAH